MMGLVERVRELAFDGFYQQVIKTPGLRDGLPVRERVIIGLYYSLFMGVLWVYYGVLWCVYDVVMVVFWFFCMYCCSFWFFFGSFLVPFCVILCLFVSFLPSFCVILCHFVSFCVIFMPFYALFTPY